MPSRRHLARIVVMQTLFETESRPVGDPIAILARNMQECGGEQAVDAPFAEHLLTGIRSHAEKVAEAIERYAPEWPLERMDPVTRAILMVGAYELILGNDAPSAVVMNEAIEVAKEFGTDESGKFVNGVLNALAHGGAGKIDN